MAATIILKKSTLPKGFRACGIHCGIKKTKKDLGLIYSEFPCVACGMFTANKVQSDSLKICRRHLNNRESRAVIANSGNANCFVGKNGISDANEIIETLANNLAVSKRSILIASTGIIGKPLPLETVKNGIPKLCRGMNRYAIDDFADSILTTDTFRKTVSLGLKINNRPILITGVAKGAGMIYPRLEINSEKHATMLAFILTDADIKKTLLKTALAEAVEKSFNCITVDGCTSTNDTVLVLANGAAKNSSISRKGRDFELFSRGLFYACSSLAQMIVDDAEGKTKRIEVLARGAKNLQEAKLASQAVANYNLFKAAMFGGNPNWGRIVAAIGAAGITIDQNRLEISFNNQKVFIKGKIYRLKTKNYLRLSKVINVDINLNRGRFSHLIKTSDLTPEYVNINAEYN